MDLSLIFGITWDRFSALTRNSPFIVRWGGEQPKYNILTISPSSPILSYSKPKPNMFKHKNKLDPPLCGMRRSTLSGLALAFLSLAFFSFAFTSVGGEFLHSKIHHHKDRFSYDQCFVSQLQIQVFTIQAVVILALFFLVTAYLKRSCHVSVFQACYNLPYSHAPPVSL